ncbi:AAA family ATPase [Candidatus Micrarchaeota archaeon]|nr:AAA family ATPase [Candidatus Micrarchaeota archaeon]
MAQIKSGIPGLDKILGGGVLEGSIITVSGPTGSGRSTFALQFILESETPGLYISIEESKKDLFFHMSGYKWNLQNEEEAGRLVILDYPIYEVDQILNQYSAIQEIIQTTGVKRVVIDSIMPIAVYFQSDDERKKGFLKLIENIRKWGVTTVIVAHDAKSGYGSGLPHTSYSIESFTDGWIHIYYEYDEKKEKRIRRVEVLKMKGTEHSSRIYPAKISSEGFRIFSDETPVSVPGKKAVLPLPAARPLKPEVAKKKLLGIRTKK